MESIPSNDRPASMYGNAPEEEQLDIKHLIYRVLGNWYWFAISIFAFLFIAYLINRYSEQVYSVTSSVIVKDDDNSKGLTGAENLIQGLKLVRNTKSVQNEIGILQAYTLAYQTVSQLPDFNVTYVAVGRRSIKEQKLYKSSPFKVILDTSKANMANYPVYINILSKDKYQLEIDDGMGISQTMQFGQQFTNDAFSFKVVLRNPNDYTEDLVGRRYYFTINDLNSMAIAYQAKVTVTLNDKKGSILTLVSTGYVAEQEADYLNKLMEVYINRGLEEKNQIAENTVKFIDVQLADMTDTLQRAEQRLQDFRTNNKVIDLKQEGGALLDRIKALQNEKGMFELKGRYYAYLKKYLADRSELNNLVAPSAMGVDDPQLGMLLDEINKTYIERAELKASVKQGNPGLEQLNIRLENLRSSLAEKVNSLIATNIVARQDIEVRMGKVEAEVLKLPGNERLLIGFERDFDLIDKMYTYLQEKRAEAAIAKASNIPDNKVLDAALPQNATIIKPKKSMNYLIALFAGGVLPLAILLLIDFLNDKLLDLKEIARHTKAPVIGTMGHNRYPSNLPVIDKSKSTLAESFRGLRTNLQYLLREPGQKVIAVTSSLSGEGKTFMAINLAAIVAMTGKKVLLLGLDLRKPKLQKLLDMESTVGVSTFLIGRNTEEEIVSATSIPNLFFAPSGPIPPNPAELLGSERMTKLIAWARSNFDYIIVDTPPVAIVTDAFLIARFADANLFVVRYAYSSKEVIKLVDDIYTHREFKNLALVVNDFQPKRSYGYGYNYRYSYGYSYSYSYGYGYGYRDKSGYYSDEDEPKLTWKDRIRQWF
ncbi:MAG TPA: polysaccharide biosynthesis tyrosine autokinase [Williamwhitmania sp.]|nr:polysaccharide biosynthesis tyrosine autokinase [Williamwhitmania sp.]